MTAAYQLIPKTRMCDLCHQWGQGWFCGSINFIFQQYWSRDDFWQSSHVHSLRRYVCFPESDDLASLLFRYRDTIASCLPPLTPASALIGCGGTRNHSEVYQTTVVSKIVHDSSSFFHFKWAIFSIADRNSPIGRKKKPRQCSFESFLQQEITPNSTSEFDNATFVRCPKDRNSPNGR